MVKLSLKKKIKIGKENQLWGSLFFAYCFSVHPETAGQEERHKISDIFCCFQIAIFSFHICYPSLHPQVVFRSLFPLLLSLVPLGMDF